MRVLAGGEICLPCTYPTPAAIHQRRDWKLAYPVPNLDPNRFLADTEAAYPAPLVSRLDDLRPASQGNRHPDRPSLSFLPYSYPAPPSFRPTRQPTSDSTKTNQPTLDPIPHTQSTLSPRIDPRIDQD
ncbi:hypothetical protein H9Q71_014435 [Fusarium xylarioides]|nr:hypothetical protein H9Q71_014435 [Fusarium xylarioides]